MADNVLEQLDFEAWVPITKAGKDPKTGDLLLSGPVASAERDFDGELLEKAGVWRGLEMHAKLGGHVDWDHQYGKTHDPKFLVGKAVERVLVDDTPWLTTKMRDSNTPAGELAKSIVQMVDDGIKVGYSVEGRGIRDPRDPSRIVDTQIHRVTLAPQPKGFDQFVRRGVAPPGLVAIAKAITGDATAEGVGCEWQPSTFTYDDIKNKALTTGDQIVESGAEGGQALRAQSLAGAMPNASFSGSEKTMKQIDEKDDTKGKRRYDDDEDDDDENDVDTTDSDDGDDDGDEDDGDGMTKGLSGIDPSQVATLDDLSDIIEKAVGAAVAPILGELESIRSTQSEHSTALKKAVSAAKTINGNIIELGGATEELQKALGEHEVNLKKAIDAKSAQDDADARMTPAPKKDVKNETILEKAVSGAPKATEEEGKELSTLIETAKEKVEKSLGRGESPDDLIKALNDVTDVANLIGQGAQDVDPKPYIANLKKAFADS